jgi:hypothetical protein
MRLTQGLSIAIAGAAFALPALAQTGALNPSGAVSKGLQAVYVLDIGGKSGVLVGVDGLPALGPPATGSPKAAPGPAPGSPMPATLMLHAGAGLPAAFYQWVTAGINTKADRTTLGLHGVDTGGRYAQTALFSDASVSDVEFPALDASGTAPMSLGVKTHGVLRMEPAGKVPTTQQVSQLAARLGSTRWLVSGFHLEVGKLDTTGVRRVESFSLKPGGALTLDVTTNDPTAQAFARITPKAAVKGQPKPLPPPLLDGRLQLATANGQVLVTILLHEVQVVSSTRQAGLNPATGASVAANHISLGAKQARVAFAPQIGQ